MFFILESLIINMQILFLIPARGGSKGLRGKNIRYLCGKPMLAHTIEAAKTSAYKGKIVVSTDDSEISNISKRVGAEVIHRPSDISTDESPTADAVLHALSTLAGDSFEPEVIVLLQPTSPLRNAFDIDSALKLFEEKNCSSVISVCESSHPPFWALTVANDKPGSLMGWEFFKKRRQDLPKTYFPNGAIFIIRTKDFLSNKTFYIQDSLAFYEMPDERSIDIDNLIDFKLAEILINQGADDK